MKKVLVFIFLACFLNCSAQTSRMTVNKHGLDSIHFAEREFKAGVIIFNDNSRTAGSFNIELIRQTVYFIDPNGSQLELSDNNIVKMVMIGKQVYYKTATEYVKLLYTSGEVGLGKSKSISILSEEKKGAFGTTSETTSIAMIGKYNSNGRSYDFDENQEIGILVKEIPYIYSGGKFSIASKKSFTKAFPEKKKIIDEYLSANRVKFDSFGDVEKLYLFLTN